MKKTALVFVIVHALYNNIISLGESLG